MRRFRRVVMAMAAIATLALFAVGPVGAAGAHRPDGWVRDEGYHSGTNYPQQGPWKGQNIYNTTALNQTATFKFVGSFLFGDYIYWTVNIQNDGSVSDRFKVHATGGGGQKYFHGSSNVTAAVVAGTFETPRLSPGSSYQLQVRSLALSLVRISSVGDPSKSDAVETKIKETCGC